MSRPCRWCGLFLQTQEDLLNHEDVHRNLDLLNGTNTVSILICFKIYNEQLKYACTSLLISKRMLNVARDHHVRHIKLNSCSHIPFK